MAIINESYGMGALTFPCTSSVKEGDLVCISSNGSVAPCSETANILGVAVQVRNGLCAVQTHAILHMTLLSAEGDVSQGYAMIEASSGSCVNIVESGGHEVYVLSYDLLNNEIEFLL